MAGVDKHNDRENKQQAEERVSNAVRQVLHTLARNLEDMGTVLEGYEQTHSSREMDASREYGGLVAGYFGTEELIKKINKALNR